MNVLLVGPDYEENLSIRYLSSSLLEAGHEVNLVPFNSANDIDSVVFAASNADLVGLSMCFQVRAQEFLELARRIKKEYPSQLIVAGGHFASCAAKDLLIHHPEIDVIVIHEGERTLVEIADSVSSLQKRLSKIKGIVYRDKNDAFYTTPRPIIEDLDSLSSPDRRGPVHLLAGVPTAYMMGSRGCFGSCDYCCITTLHRLTPGKRFRQRSTENIADEMVTLYNERGIRQFIFHDDNFLVPSVNKNHQRLDALESALANRGVKDIAFAIKCRPHDVDRDIFKKLQEMGLLRVFLGIESGNSIGLSSIGRKQTVAEAERALEICEDLGISTQYTIMIFHPSATIDTIREDIAFMRYNINHPLRLTRAEILAGTPLEQRMIDEGRARGNYLARYYHLFDPAADLVCALAKKNLLKRCWVRDNLMDFAIGTDHLSEVMNYFYRGAEIEALYKDIQAWWLEVNKSSVNLLEKLVDICVSDPHLLYSQTRSTIQELIEEENLSRNLLYSRGADLRCNLEKLTLEMVGLQQVGNEARKMQSRQTNFARHAAAVMIAFSIAGAVPTIGVADPPSPPLEEDEEVSENHYWREDRLLEEDEEDLENHRWKGDGLYDIYEVNIFRTSPTKLDTDGDGIPDRDEDHDGDGISNLDEQEQIIDLMYAVEMGYLEEVQYLLDAGTYVDAKDNEGMTVLMRAAWHGHTEIVKILLRANAKVNVRDNDEGTALMRAAEHGHTEIVQALLSTGSHVDARDKYGYTALMRAAWEGQTETVKIFLDAGADVKVKANDGWTALMWAKYMGHTSIIEILKKAGAKE